MQKHNYRITYLDTLRATACLFVVAIHTILGWTDFVANHDARVVVDITIAETIFHTAVPIFLMISGALLLRKEKEINWRKTKSYVLRMILVLATFGLAYCLIESFSNGDRGFALISNSIMNLLSGKSWAAMWYIYMIIGIYILTPVLKKYTDNCTQKDFTILITILLFICSVIPTINGFTNTHLTQFYLDGLIYVFYYLLGQYSYRYNISTHIIAPIGIIGIMGTSIQYLFNIPFSGSTLASTFVVMTSFALFSLIKNLNPRNNKATDLIAKYSFGIYLVHTFWLNVLNKGFNVNPGSLPPVIGEFSIFSYALLASIASCFILYRLPFFKKILQ